MTGRALAVTLAVLAASCLGTPQPDPPNLAPDLLESVGTRGDEVEVTGGAGSVSPAGALLRIVSLDRDEPVVEAVADDHGAFSVLVPGLEGEEMRLQVVSGEERSAPLDVVFFGGLARAVDRPLSECFLALPGPEIEVTAGEPATVRLENHCGEPLSLSRVSLRRAASSFAVTEAPVEVADGGSAEVVVSYGPVPGEPDEAILLIESDSPELDRRPVTLVGR